MLSNELNLELRWRILVLSVGIPISNHSQTTMAYKCSFVSFMVTTSDMGQIIYSLCTHWTIQKAVSSVDCIPNQVACLKNKLGSKPTISQFRGQCLQHLAHHLHGSMQLELCSESSSNCKPVVLPCRLAWDLNPLFLNKITLTLTGQWSAGGLDHNVLQTSGFHSRNLMNSVNWSNDFCNKSHLKSVTSCSVNMDICLGVKITHLLVHSSEVEASGSLAAHYR